MKLLLALLLAPILAYAQEPCVRDNQSDCTVATPVPIDNPLALIALGVGIAGVAARVIRRKR